MKKLMIAAAIALVAVAGQAANAVWNLSGLKGSDGSTTLNGAYVYTFCTKGTLGITSANLKTALEKATTAAAFQTVLETYAIDGLSGTASDGKLNKSTAAADIKVTSGTTGTKFYSIVLDGADIASSTKYCFSTTSNGGSMTDPDGKTDFAQTVTDAKTKVASNWVAIPGSGDVPEPTSAMLLLLGVAGLALRRKQA